MMLVLPVPKSPTTRILYKYSLRGACGCPLVMALDLGDKDVGDDCLDADVDFASFVAAAVVDV